VVDVSITYTHLRAKNFLNRSKRKTQDFSGVLLTKRVVQFEVDFEGSEKSLAGGAAIGASILG
jgi:hypothetical protein